MIMAGSRVFAAMAVSGVVHAGAAFVEWPAPTHALDGALGAAPLRVTLASGATPQRRVADLSAAPSVAAGPQSAPALVAAGGAARVASARRAAPAPMASDVPTVAEPPAGADSEPIQVASPTPISYPVFTLPANDDPRRVGIARLLLVVSSQGQTTNVIVTASTMSQDYVDELVKTFAAMRFEPARVRGLPYPGTYEVVVNFAFDAAGRAY